MNRERVLTVAGASVAVIMAGLLSYTTVNGRTLGYPRDDHGEEAEVAALERELRHLIVEQTAYRARQRRYATDLAEIGFTTHDPDIAVTVVAADRDGLTAVATNEEHRVACIMKVGSGSAARADVDSLLASRGVEFDVIETCEVADPTRQTNLISEVLGDRS